jgi:hypothetical protein
MREAVREPGEPTQDEIVAALRTAGWLLEQEADIVLGERGFHTTLNSAFPDPEDASKSREVDVMAYKQVHRDEALRVSVGVRCLVECKQSTMPYVLIGKPPNDAERKRRKLEQVFRFDEVIVGRTEVDPTKRSYRLDTLDAREYIGLNDIDQAPWNHDFVATQMTRLERKQTWLADNRGIFDGLVYPLAKATHHYRKRHYVNKATHDPSQGWAHIEFLYPIVVTSAPIYKLDVSVAPYAPEKVAWVPMLRELRSGSLDGVFVIDVVTFQSFATYLDDHVLAFIRGVEKIAQTEPSLFVTSGYDDWVQKYSARA